MKDYEFEETYLLVRKSRRYAVGCYTNLKSARIRRTQLGRVDYQIVKVTEGEKIEVE